MFLPVDNDLINKRGLLMLHAAPPERMPPALAQELYGRIEAGFSQSPHVGNTITRAEFASRFGGNASLNHEYTLVSDTLNAVGVADWEQVNRVGQATGQEMVVGFQVYYIPCPACESGDQVAATAHMIHAPTGLLVWRGTFLRETPPAPAQVAVNANAAVTDLVQAFNNSLRPKWHRERFRSLARPGSDTRKLTRELASIEKSRSTPPSPAGSR